MVWADIFNNLDDIKRQFHHLIKIIPSNGNVVYFADDKNIRDLIDMGIWSNQIAINDNAHSIEAAYSDKTLKYEESIYSINIIELRIVILMKFIDYYLKKNNLNEIEELSIACTKIYDSINNSKNLFDKICNIEGFNIELSSLLIQDFKLKIDELKEKYNIKLYDIANKRPKLIFETKYDSTISVIKMKPYQ